MGYATDLSRELYRRVEPVLPAAATRAVDGVRAQRALNCHRTRRLQVEKEFYDYLVERCGHFVRGVDPGPAWTRELVLQTAVMDESQVESLCNPDRYFASGYAMLLNYLRVAEAHGFNLRTARAVFELGCGSARLLRHFRAVSGLRLVGSDINEASNQWCREHLPGIEFYENGHLPPLPFAEEDTFDLAIASSVFTHIPLDTQRAWLGEMRRVLRPGGYFLCTVLGDVIQRTMLSEVDREELERQGELCLDASRPNVSHSTRVTGTWDVFQVRWNLLNTFGAYFDVLDYLPGHHDLIVARKPAPGFPGGLGASTSAGLQVARTAWV